MKARTLILTAGAIVALAAPAAQAASDVTTVIRPVSFHTGTYQVEVDNTSGLGAINTFDWIPPEAMTITAVTSTKGGSCKVAHNVISCSGGKHGIAPPSCTCHVGGRLTFTFTATGNRPTFNGKYWTYYGIGSVTEITSMSPVLYHIPSYVPQEDLPVCELGTQPSDENQCVVQ